MPGKSTQAAIEAGLTWGMVGAVREIINQLEKTLDRQPDLLVTGGQGKWLANGLSIAVRPVDYHPHLVIRGIASLSSESSGV